MFIVTGSKDEIVNDIWAGVAQCPHCNQMSHFQLRRLVRKVTAYFIPVATATQQRYLYCNSCGWSKTLSIKEYREIKKKQTVLLEQGGFPNDVIAKDFHPDNLKFGWRIFKLVVSCFILAMTAISLLSMTFDVMSRGNYADGLMILLVSVCMIALFGLPFFFSLKNFLFAFKKKRAYQALFRR